MRRMRAASRWALCCAGLWSSGAALAAKPAAEAAATAHSTPTWIAHSNRHSQLLLKVTASFSPEDTGALGIEGLDTQVTRVGPGPRAERRQALQRVVVELEKRRADEKEPRARQDLELLLRAARSSLRGAALQEKYFLPYAHPAQRVFEGVRALLDDQVSRQRRRAAIVRLRKYVGADPGAPVPLAVQLEKDLRASLPREGLLAPFKEDLQRDLDTSPQMVEGVEKLFAEYGLTGHEKLLARFRAQVATYEGFVREHLLPRASHDFRLPPEYYAYLLDQSGVEMAPEALMALGKESYQRVQRQMDVLAAEIARERKVPAAGYRDVIRALKKEQLVGEAIVPHYQQRIRDLEEIIRREKLVSLPSRPMRIRLASAAESAQSPAPYMRPPRMLGNTGEQGEFVLPLSGPTGAGGDVQMMDDFTHAAASWTLTAHEGRPGHEMQYARMVEEGLSSARSIFAFNSANVEGWGLYAEEITRPFMPKEGQLISLQLQLMRAARAFLDPGLQLGRVTPEEALRLLREDVVLSLPMATQEVQRYTFRSPGQATAYFYGYTQLLALRAEVEKRAGSAFDRQRFHDLVLTQGPLPGPMLRAAVLADYFASPSDAG